MHTCIFKLNKYTSIKIEETRQNPEHLLQHTLNISSYPAGVQHNVFPAYLQDKESRNKYCVLGEHRELLMVPGIGCHLYMNTLNSFNPSVHAVSRWSGSVYDDNNQETLLFVCMTNSRKWSNNLSEKCFAKQTNKKVSCWLVYLL